MSWFEKEDEDKQAFINDLAGVINKHSMENESNTPDYVLAEYLYNCMISYKTAIMGRNDFFKENGTYSINPLEPNNSYD